VKVVVELQFTLVLEWGRFDTGDTLDLGALQQSTCWTRATFAFASSRMGVAYPQDERCDLEVHDA
jgi:hypothetical protein